MTQTQTLEKVNFRHLLNLYRRVLSSKIDEAVATHEVKRLKARANWYELILELRLECLKIGIDYDLLDLDSFFQSPKTDKKEILISSVQTDTPTCPVCDVEIPKGKKYCSNEHRYQYHNHKKRKND